MPSSAEVRKGQVLACVVKSACNGHVVADVGHGREGSFRAQASSHRFRKADVVLCEVVDACLRGGRIALRETFGFKLRQNDEAEIGTDATRKSLASRRTPLSEVKVGSRVDGTVTNVACGRVFVDFGAAVDGAIKMTKGGKEPRRGLKLQRLTVVSVSPETRRVELQFWEPDEQDVIARVERDWGRCLGLYVHGSTIFSNKPPDDIDLLAVVEEPEKRRIRSDSVDFQFKLGRYEVSLYTRSAWLQKMAAMDLTMLTSLSLPERFVLLELDPELRSARVDPAALHGSIVSYAEFTWVKAHFMLEQKEDVYRSSKNAYFVMRVLELGRQLMEHRRIVDFSAANPWWDTIRDLYEQLSVKPGDWDIVEAALGSRVQREFVRFHESLAKSLQPLLPRKLPRPLLQDVAAYLAERPSLCQVAAAAAATPSRACLCRICSKPMLPDAATSVTLVRCGHSFHRGCVAGRIRSPDAGGSARCWTCQEPLQLGLDRDMLAAYQEGSGAGGRPRFGGYPATRLLAGEGPLDAASARAMLYAMMQ